jgi:hypothetical protein
MFEEIKNLQKFCSEVVDEKLLWTPEVLNFFNVPASAHPKFERAREDHAKKLFHAIDS